MVGGSVDQYTTAFTHAHTHTHTHIKTVIPTMPLTFCAVANSLCMMMPSGPRAAPTMSTSGWSRRVDTKLDRASSVMSTSCRSSLNFVCSDWARVMIISACANLFISSWGGGGTWAQKYSLITSKIRNYPHLKNLFSVCHFLL